MVDSGPRRVDVKTARLTTKHRSTCVSAITFDFYNRHVHCNCSANSSDIVVNVNLLIHLTVRGNLKRTGGMGLR